MESTRLHTRTLRLDDTRALLALYSDEHAMRFRKSDALLNRDDALLMVRRAEWENNLVQHQRLAITLRCGALAGTLLLKTSKQPPQSCDISFSFGPAYWRKGLATETLAMVESHLRSSTDVQTLTAWSAKANVAAVKVFSNAGFVAQDQNTQTGRLFFHKVLH